MAITAAGVCCDADAWSHITDTCLLARIQAYRLGLSFDINYRPQTKSYGLY